MSRIVMDMEGDSFTPTKIHVMAWYDVDKKEHLKTYSYDEMRKVLLEAKTIIGHNIIRFDIPALERILKIKIEARPIDTLPLSWYLYPNKIKHGLDDWGETFGIPKPKIDDWKNLSKEEYAHRCQEDVKINLKLWYKELDDLQKIYSDRGSYNRLINYLGFKMRCARMQEDAGWRLDCELAGKTYEQFYSKAEAKKA